MPSAMPARQPCALRTRHYVVHQWLATLVLTAGPHPSLVLGVGGKAGYDGVRETFVPPHLCVWDIRLLRELAVVTVKDNVVVVLARAVEVDRVRSSDFERHGRPAVV